MIPTPDPTIVVLYTCHPCGLVKQRLVVRARRPDEGLDTWMAMLQHALKHDHTRVSPTCPADKCDLMIPMGPGAQRVGETSAQ